MSTCRGAAPSFDSNRVDTSSAVDENDRLFTYSCVASGKLLRGSRSRLGGDDDDEEEEEVEVEEEDEEDEEDASEGKLSERVVRGRRLFGLTGLR